VAPATANYVNKTSQGIGDDLVTTMFLAHDFKKPFLIAPAMNTSMYLHPVTQKSIQSLKAMGIEILETASGVLACGEVGWGRLLEPDLIVEEVKRHLSLKTESINQTPIKKSLAQKILITSGGTEEAIDRVRSLTNKSTGATGAYLADHFSQLGFDVVYLHAENAKMVRQIGSSGAGGLIG
jgi:phosphopantothenoylcysteine decarboxylase/phosphopantothenate--cysteine ligase